MPDPQNSSSETPSIACKFANSFAPTRVFLALSMLFGVILVVLIPPFQIADEQTHLLRAYQISQGQLIPTWEHQRGGGLLPLSLAKVCDRFAGVRFNLKTTSYREISDAMKIPLKPQEQMFFFFWGSASYSPMVYFPQAAGIALSRLAGVPPLASMYVGRFFNLLVWVTLCYIALRISSGIARPLLLLMLMPMTLFQAASLSPDAFTNGLAFLLAALFWREVGPSDLPRTPFVGWRWLSAFVAVSAMLSLTKLAYLPFASLLFLLPTRRLGNPKQLIVILLISAIGNFGLIALWAAQTPGLHMITNLMSKKVQAHAQLDFLMNQPQSFLRIIINSAEYESGMIVQSFVGRLGWLNIQLNVYYVIAYIMALIFSCRPGLSELPVSRRAPIIVGTASAIALATYAVLLLNYLFWTPVGAPQIDGLQGRYFIPIAPFVLILIRCAWEMLPDRLHSRATNHRGEILTACIALLSCTYMLILLYIHFYVSVAAGKI